MIEQQQQQGKQPCRVTAAGPVEATVLAALATNIAIATWTAMVAKLAREARANGSRRKAAAMQIATRLVTEVLVKPCAHVSQHASQGSGP